jgi:hypothetical protein
MMETRLVRCENIGCKHNSSYGKKWKKGHKDTCTLPEVHLVMSFGRSTNYAHELVCEQQDGWGYY